MKKYELKLPKKLDNIKKEISEFILVKHYEDGVFSSGACAFLLNIEKYHFQTKILNKYEKKE